MFASVVPSVTVNTFPVLEMLPAGNFVFLKYIESIINTEFKSKLIAVTLFVVVLKLVCTEPLIYFTVESGLILQKTLWYNTSILAPVPLVPVVLSKEWLVWFAIPCMYSDRVGDCAFNCLLDKKPNKRTKSK